MFDSADNLTYLASDLNLGAEKLLGLRNSLAGEDHANLELQFCKIIVGNLCFRLDIDALGFLVLFLLRLCLCSNCLLLLFLDNFDFLHHIVEFQAGKENLRLLSHLISGRITAKCIHLWQFTFYGI